jgi:outer membrane protein
MYRHFATLLVAALAASTHLSSATYAMDLKSVLDDVARTSPNIAAQQAVVGQLKARVDEARAGYYPTVIGNAALERRKLIVGGDIPDSTFTSKSVGVEAKMPIFRGFQTTNSVQLRKAEMASGASQYQGTVQSVLLDTISSYANVIRDRKILGYNQTQVELVQGQLKATRTRFGKGEATRTDESQAEARVAVAMSSRANAQEALALSESDFRRAVGQSPEQLMPLPGINNLPATWDEAQALALAESPQLTAAKSNEEAARRGIGFSKGFLYPSVDAVAGVDYLSGGVANLFTGALPNDRRAYYGGVQAQIPFFQGGTEYARIRGAKETLNQRRNQRIIAEREVADQVSRAWAQWMGAKSIIESASTAVIANEKAAEGVRRESLGGNRTVLDVLDAQRELLDARVALERSINNEYVARAALMGAIGRLTPQNFASVK